MKKPLYIKPANKTFMIPEHVWNVLAVYKMFFPPETTVKLGKKIVTVADIFPWPPPEQQALLDIPEEVVKKMVDMG